MDDRKHGVMCILGTGCQWTALPKDLHQKSTVNDYFCRWTDDRTLDRIHHALYVGCWENTDREVSPTVAIIDSQSRRRISGTESALSLQIAAQPGGQRDLEDVDFMLHITE